MSWAPGSRSFPPDGNFWATGTGRGVPNNFSSLVALQKQEVEPGGARGTSGCRAMKGRNWAKESPGGLRRAPLSVPRAPATDAENKAPAVPVKEGQRSASRAASRALPGQGNGLQPSRAVSPQGHLHSVEAQRNPTLVIGPVVSGATALPDSPQKSLKMAFAMTE